MELACVCNRPAARQDRLPVQIGNSSEWRGGARVCIDTARDAQRVIWLAWNLGTLGNRLKTQLETFLQMGRAGAARQRREEKV